MFFSIIVPMYNVEKYLSKCIESILNQHYKDMEIIIIDDKSTDNSLSIAEKYEKYKNIKIISKERNSGLSESRNIGIREARGKYIIFLDSDDYIDENALLDLNKLICEHEFPDIIYTKFIEEREEYCEEKCGYVSESNKIYSRYDFLKSELEKRNLYAAACFGVYKRKLIIDNKLFFKPGICHEDELWTPQVINKAETIYLSDLAYYHYIRRDNSITKAKDKTKNGIDLINTCYELFVLFNDMDDNYLKKLMNNHIAMLYMKAMCRGKLFRKKYAYMIDKKIPLKYASTLKDRIKAILFLCNLHVYYLIDSQFGDNER